MPFIAILGAGAIGGALAHRLAARARVRDIRLIDDERRIAEGKALDILQSAPIEGWPTRLSAAGTLEDAVGAAVIVIADGAAGGAEHAGESALASLRRLARMEAAATLVFAGAAQRELMQRALSELHVPARRVVGSAPGALQAAVRARTALELNGTGVDIQLLVTGVPPRAAVIAWESATASGQPLGALVPAHRLAAISASLPALWPPGPLALASAAARVVEALADGSRRTHTCFVACDSPPAKGTVAALPVELGKEGVRRVVKPALSRQEQTQLDNAIAGAIS